MTSEPLSDAELAHLGKLAEHATPDPWYIRLLHVAISTEPDTNCTERSQPAGG